VVILGHWHVQHDGFQVTPDVARMMQMFAHPFDFLRFKQRPDPEQSVGQWDNVSSFNRHV
jgi:hypothetical protein